MKKNEYAALFLLPLGCRYARVHGVCSIIRGGKDKVRAHALILDVHTRWLALCTMLAGGLYDVSSSTVLWNSFFVLRSGA